MLTASAIPAPIATLAATAFVLLGVLYQPPIAVVAAIILGIGFIWVHFGFMRELSGR